MTPSSSIFSRLQKSRLVPVVFFFLLTLLFFYRVIISGEVLRGSDFILSYNIFIKFALDYFHKYSTPPFWLPYIFGGMPVVECLLVPFFYPTFWLLLILPFNLAMNCQYLIHIFFAGFLTYLLARELGVRRTAALFSGIAYMFSGSVLTILAAGHYMKVYTYGLYPAVFLLVYKGLKTRRLFYFLAASGVMGLMFLSLHMQVIYYGLMLLSLFTAYWLITDYLKEKNLNWLIKGGVFYLITIIVGLGIGMVQFYPAFEYMGYSHRQKGVDYEFATSWSLPPEEITDLIAPGFAGERAEYFGRIPFMDRHDYASVLPLILALIAIIFVRRREVYFFLFGSLFILSISLGGYTPVYKLYYHLIPGINKFRLPMSSLYLFAFFQALLAGLGIEWCLTQEKKFFSQTAKIILGALALVFLVAIGLYIFRENLSAYLVKLAALDEEMKYKWVDTIMATQNLSLTLKAFVHLGIILLLTSLIFFSRSYFSNSSVLSCFWLLLLAGDLFLVNSKYLQPALPDSEYYKESLWKYIKQDNDLFRVHRIGLYDLPRVLGAGNVAVYHRVYSTNGYYQNPVGRYYDIEDYEEGVLSKSSNFLALSNVKYVISANPTKNKNFTTLSNSSDIYFYRNNLFLPRYYFSHTYEVVNNPKEIIQRLTQINPENLTQQIYLENVIEFQPQPAMAGESYLVKEYTANEIKLEAYLSAPGFLVMSEVYYPAWEAEVDGKKQEILLANYFMRALPLPAGRHQITMRYNPKAVKIGLVITLISTVICLLSLILIKSRQHLI